MLSPDFEKYSLALVKDNRIIYFSNKSGLKPLLECLEKYKSRQKDCTLYDKVVGLAAAQLIVYSEMISLIVTQVVSKQAKELLDKKSIQLKAENIVENILTKDRSSICPMELKAQETRGNGLFYNMIKAIKISN